MKKFLVFCLVSVMWSTGVSMSWAQDSGAPAKGAEPLTITLTHQDLQLSDEARQLRDIFLKVALLTDPQDSDQASPAQMKFRMQQVRKLLIEAGGLATDEAVKKYLLALAEDLSKKDFSESGALWMEVKDQPLDFFVKLRKKQRRMDSYLVYHDAEATLALQPLRTAADRMLDELNVKREYIDNLGRLIAPIEVTRLLYGPEVRRFVVMAPSEPVTQKRPGFKLLVLRNVADAYFEKVLKPIASEMLVGAWAGAADKDSFFHYLVLQKIGHYVGPVLVSDKSENQIQKVADMLGKLLGPLEIVKSHVLAARFISYLVKEKIVEKDREKGMQALYIVYLVDKLRHGPTDKAMLPYLAQFNILLSKGAIGFDIQKKRFYIDIPTFKKSVEELSFDVLGLIQKGNSKAVMKFFDKYQEVPTELEDVLKRLSGLPLDVDIVTPNPLAN